MEHGVDVLDRMGIYVFERALLIDVAPIRFPASRLLERVPIPDVNSGRFGFLYLHPNSLQWYMPRRIYLAVVDHAFARPTVERLSREACLAVTAVPLSGVSSRDVSETLQPFAIRWTVKRDARSEIFDAVEVGWWLREPKPPNFCAVVEGESPKLRAVYVVRWEERREGIFLQAALPFLREELEEFWYLVLEITHRRIHPLHE